MTRVVMFIRELIKVIFKSPVPRKNPCKIFVVPDIKYMNAMIWMYVTASPNASVEYLERKSCMIGFAKMNTMKEVMIV